MLWIIFGFIYILIFYLNFMPIKATIPTGAKFYSFDFIAKNVIWENSHIKNAYYDINFISEIPVESNLQEKA